MIYNHINEYPGVSFSTLKKVHDLNDSTLRYHLQYLERGQKVSSNIQNGQLHYYPYNNVDKLASVPISNISSYKLTSHQQHILNTIKNYPGISQKELGHRTSLKRFILTYNLTKLIDLGMIRKFNNSRNVCYECITKEQLQAEMLRVLAVKLLSNEIDEQTFNQLKKKLGS